MCTKNIAKKKNSSYRILHTLRPHRTHCIITVFRYRLNMEAFGILNKITKSVINNTWHCLQIIYWCFLFCKENVTLLQCAYKKLLTSPVIMQLFTSEGQNTNIKKGYACVCHLLRSVARSILVRLHIFNAC